MAAPNGPQSTCARVRWPFTGHLGIVLFGLLLPGASFGYFATDPQLPSTQPNGGAGWGIPVSVKIEKDVTWPDVSVWVIYVGGAVLFFAGALWTVKSLWSAVLDAVSEGGNKRAQAVRQLLGEVVVDGKMTKRGRLKVWGAGLLGTLLVLLVPVALVYFLHIEFKSPPKEMTVPVQRPLSPEELRELFKGSGWTIDPGTRATVPDVQDSR
jgi:hypothetical protein